MSDAAAVDDDVLRAALQLWEVLGRFAWAECGRRGPGVVLIDHDDLLAAARAEAPAGQAPTPAMSYVPATHVPRGDDFAALIGRYDPGRQVLLLVGTRGGDEQMLVLEPADESRPSPPQC